RARSSTCRFPSDDRGYGCGRTDRHAGFSLHISGTVRPVLRALRTIAAFLAAAGVPCATAPAAEQLTAISPGVTVLGLPLGGLTAQPAGSRISARFARPIVIAAGRKRITVAPARLDARASVDAAV